MFAIKNKNILRGLSLGVGLAILSCTDNKRRDIVDTINDEKGPDDLIKKDFIELAGSGSYEQIRYHFPTCKGLLDRATIEKAINKALNNGNRQFVDFLRNEIFPEMGEDWVDFLSLNCEKIQGFYGSNPLHWAISQNNYSIIPFLLREKGINVNSVDLYGNTLLHLAIRMNYLDVVDILLKNGKTNVNVKNDEGNTPLHLAIRMNYLDVVDILLKDRRTNIKVTDNLGRTPLHLAVWGNNLDMIKLLLNKEAKINVKDDEGNTPLHLAVCVKNLDIVNYLLEKGIRINAQNKNGTTPFHFAVLSDNPEMVDLLRRKKAQVSDRDKNENTALNLALDEKKLNIAVKLLAEMNARANANNIGNDLFYGFGFYGGKDGFPLHQAVVNNNISRVKELLEDKNIKESINCYDAAGCTPLFLAVGVNNKKMVDLLLNNGADINVRCSKWLITPLHLACAMNNQNMVDYLFRKGANIMGENVLGEVPLGWFYTRGGDRVSHIRHVIKWNMERKIPSGEINEMEPRKRPFNDGEIIRTDKDKSFASMFRLAQGVK